MDELKQMARHDRRRAELGQYAACAACGSDDNRELRRAFIAATNGAPLTVVLCASCWLQLRGLSPFERHHLAAKANSPVTAAIPANDHAVLTDMQQDWPRETWRNPDGSPLLAMAGALRGWLDVLRLMLERTVGWIPDALETLDQVLRTQKGETWWLSIGFELNQP